MRVANPAPSLYELTALHTILGVHIAVMSRLHIYHSTGICELNTSGSFKHQDVPFGSHLFVVAFSQQCSKQCGSGRKTRIGGQQVCIVTVTYALIWTEGICSHYILHRDREKPRLRSSIRYIALQTSFL